MLPRANDFVGPGTLAQSRPMRYPRCFLKNATVRCHASLAAASS